MEKDLRNEMYFFYTQYSMKTFESCPLKFKKRYLEGIRWRFSPSEEIVNSMEAGRKFHVLARRYFMGFDNGLKWSSVNYPELVKWMGRLIQHFPLKKDEIYLPEYKIRMISGEIKLEANFDLLIIKNEKIEIWDWKTHGSNKKHTGLKNRLEKSLQTMVYLYVLKERVRLAAGKNIPCDKITMYYWKPEPVGICARIDYSDEKHKRFSNILREKILDIKEFDYNHFNQELYKNHCPFCEFNSFCNNRKVSYDKSNDTEDFLENLDWYSIEGTEPE